MAIDHPYSEHGVDGLMPHIAYCCYEPKSHHPTSVETTPAGRIRKAAERLSYHGDFIYGNDWGESDVTPKPTCAGCGASDWLPEKIVHRPDCAVEELIAAVRAITR